MAATALAILATAISVAIGGLVLEGVLRVVRLAFTNVPPFDPSPADMPVDFTSRMDEQRELKWRHDLAA
jgi:hypothetical protein